MAPTKFWIVEYVDVDAPKVERSELCASRKEALRKAMARPSFIHFNYVNDYAGWGQCDSQPNRTPFYTGA
jgi:hypothetical protein